MTINLSRVKKKRKKGALVLYIVLDCTAHCVDEWLFCHFSTKKALLKLSVHQILWWTCGGFFFFFSIPLWYHNRGSIFFCFVHVILDQKVLNFITKQSTTASFCVRPSTAFLREREGCLSERSALVQFPHLYKLTSILVELETKRSHANCTSSKGGERSRGANWGIGVGLQLHPTHKPRCLQCHKRHNLMVNYVTLLHFCSYQLDYAEGK